MRRLAGLALVLLAAGCRSEPDLELTSLDPDARWLQGQQVVPRESEGASVVAGFTQSVSGHLIFDVSIVNRSDSTVLIDPERFHFTLAGSGDVSRAAYEIPFAAIDPEAVLARLDRLASQLESAHAAGAAIHALLEVADVVFDLVGAISTTGEEQAYGEHFDQERAMARQQADEAFESAMGTLDQGREFWASSALWRTHLGPGQSVSGLIALPVGPIPRLLSRRIRSGSITDFPDGLALPPGETLTLTLHLPVGEEIGSVAFDVRRLSRVTN